MVEAPAAEIVFEVHQLFTQFIERPVAVHILVDRFPPCLDVRAGVVRCVELRRGGGFRPLHGGKEQGNDLVVEARPGQFRAQRVSDLRPVFVRFDHVGVAVAQDVFDQPVLVGLEARGRPERLTKPRVVGWRHGAQHVPGAVELLEDAADAGQHLEHLGHAASPQGLARGGEFVQGQLHPKLARLVLDDEQHLVMGVAQRVLLRENAVEMQVIAVGHGGAEIHLRAVAAGVVGLVAHGAPPGTGLCESPARTLWGDAIYFKLEIV